MDLGSPYWEIEEGAVNSVRFFELLAPHFPDATTLFAEGCSIGQDVQECYAAHLEPGPFLPGRNTIWPVSAKHRCRFSRSLAVDLAQLAQRHAEPELLDHFFLYSVDRYLIAWPDAFSNAMWLSGMLTEQRVAAFARELNLPFGLHRE